MNSWSFHLSQNRNFDFHKTSFLLSKATAEKKFDKIIISISLNTTLLRTKNDAIQITFVEPRYSNIFILSIIKKEDLFNLYDICKFSGLERDFFFLIYKFISQVMVNEFTTITLTTFSKKIFSDFIETSFSKGLFYDNKETVDVKYEFKCKTCDDIHTSPLSIIINPDHISVTLKKVDKKWLSKSFALIRDSFEHFKEYFSEEIWLLLMFSIIENIIEMKKIKTEMNLSNQLLNYKGNEK